MQLYFTTKNKSKVNEVRSILEPQGIELVVHPLTLNEYSIEHQDIVKRKAEQAFEALQHPVIVDDTAMYFTKYKNFPGPLCNYIFQALGLDGLYKLFDEGDAASFHSLICFRNNSCIELFEGVLSGTLTKRPSSDYFQMPYSALFVPQGTTQTLAELMTESGLRIETHRTIALQKLVRFLQSQSQPS